MAEEVKRIAIEINAPPDGWEYDGERKAQNGEKYYSNGSWHTWTSHDPTYQFYPVAVDNRPNELVRFFVWNRDSNKPPELRTPVIHAFDDIGDVTYGMQIGIKDWSPIADQSCGLQYFVDKDSRTELHPRLTIRRINGIVYAIPHDRYGHGEALSEMHPCDPNGNPLKKDATSTELLPQLPEPSVKRYEVEPKVDISGDWYLKVGLWQLDEVISLPDFRGAIYRHPNGYEREVGFVHPIYVKPDHPTEHWEWSHSKRTNFTHMIRPVAVLLEEQQ